MPPWWPHGTTPQRWPHRTRTGKVRHLLGTPDLPVERMAVQVGFGSPTAFRDRSERPTGSSPYAYLRAFG